MTVIAYTKGVMCADKRTSIYSTHITTTKIERMPNGALVGCSGVSPLARVMRAWYRAGAVAKDFPDMLLSGNDTDMLVVERDGRILHWSTNAEPLVIEDTYASIGSCMTAAHALMFIGMSAYDTVEILCKVSGDCGNGIDFLTLREGANAHGIGPDVGLH